MDTMDLAFECVRCVQWITLLAPYTASAISIQAADQEPAPI